MHQDGSAISDQDFLVSRDGPTLTMTINRPHVRNSMTWNTYDRLVQACDLIDSDDTIRVAVLRGAGTRAFASGTDISEFADFRTGADGVAYEKRLTAVLDRLEAVRVPTVAAISGYAVGGGLALAAACDLRVCTPDARFGVPIARTLGNCLSMATYWRLCHLIGAARTAELLMLGGFLEAQDARSAGFVTRVAVDRSLDEEVRDVCDTLLSNSPLSISATKTALRRLRRVALPDDEDFITACYGSDDFHEGVRAFRERRPPRWVGH